MSRLTSACALALSCSGLILSLGCQGDTQSVLGPETPPSASSSTATAPLAFIQVSAGATHSCGLTAGNQAYCWGSNGSGELGIGSSDGDTHSSPLPVSGGLSFAQVKAGFFFSCGITLGNQAYCWGSNRQGQLGDGGKTNRSAPVPVAGGRSFRRVSPAEFHTCALTPGNVAFCWGNNASGKLGDGTMTERLIPTRVKSGGLLFQQVVAGYTHSCGLGQDGLGYCWGANFSGQIGDGTTTDRTIPTPIKGGRSLLQISAGQMHNCAVTTANAAYCWGSDREGELGDGASGHSRRRLVPVAVLGGVSFTAVFAGGTHSCGVTAGKVAYCWGYNVFGQVGDGTNTRRTVPTKVIGGHRFSGVSTGFDHSCGVATDQNGYCWGSNGSARLGDGTDALERTEPVAIAPPS